MARALLTGPQYTGQCRGASGGLSPQKFKLLRVHLGLNRRPQRLAGDPGRFHLELKSQNSTVD